MANRYLNGIILRMIPALALDAIAVWRSTLFLFGDFPDKRWPLNALLRFTFPVPVKSKRFFEALCERNFGIQPTVPGLSRALPHINAGSAAKACTLSSCLSIYYSDNYYLMVCE